MFTNADALREEYASLEAQMADPATHSDMALSRRVGRRYSELTPIVRALAEHDTLTADLEAARELAADDPAFAEEGVDLVWRNIAAGNLAALTLIRSGSGRKN